MATPGAEIRIDVALVAMLLREQQPQLSEAPVRLVGNGWDNAIVRVGDDLVARLPRRAASAALILHEQRWLPVLAPMLPLPIPVPVFVGAPSAAFPWHWSLSPWLPGSSAAERPPRDAEQTATVLAAFVRALHRPAPIDAPENPFRGVALQRRAEAVDTRLTLLGDVVDAAAASRVWNDLAATPRWDGEPMWLHGDLHPSNMLTTDGELSAVINFGDVTAGDPATDLALAWMMFDRANRDLFRTTAQVDDLTWRRAAGWALNLSLAYLTGDDSTSMPRIGRRTLTEVLHEFG